MPSREAPPPFTADTPITSACESDADPNVSLLSSQLPQELLDLLSLHAAFLKALSLHLAHNGSHAPVDVRVICPSVAQAWGKRRVTLDDVRRCVAVHDDGVASPFFLSDYGRGKVCVELHAHAAGAGPLSEQALNRRFEANLRQAWAAQGNEAGGAGHFVQGLPKAPLRDCASSLARAAHPMLAKGQRTLEELKQGIAAKRQAEEEKKQKVVVQRQQVDTPMANADGSKMSLLDRIRQRQLQQSETTNTTPSPAELARRAAMQRAGDVAAVLAMLSRTAARGQARISFTLPAVLVKLRDSLRVPVSREESASCVRVLAGEIAPQWLRVVTVGGVENVVVQTAFAPSQAAIQERVRALSA